MSGIPDSSFSQRWALPQPDSGSTKRLMTTNCASPLKKAAGFSIIELLVAISLIAVVSAAVVPNIAGVTESAKTAVAQRNAQSIAATWNAAVAAGYRPDPETVTSHDIAVSQITEGVTVTFGTLTNTFRVDGLNEDERIEAQQYLNLNSSSLTLSYTPAG